MNQTLNAMGHKLHRVLIMMTPVTARMHGSLKIDYEREQLGPTLTLLSTSFSTDCSPSHKCQDWEGAGSSHKCQHWEGAD